MSKRNMFYFDESFHTRVITKGYIKDDNNCDSYIGVSVGWNASKDVEIRSAYQAFEEKYKTFYEVEEVKSQVIKKKFYQYGIASFKKNQITFYDEYFSIVEKGIYVYICVLSKMETVLRQIIAPVYGYGTREGQILLYVLTKAILLYRPENVMSALFDKSELFVQELKKFIKKKINEICGLEHKTLELNIFKECLLILNLDVQESLNFEWYYDIAFWGFKLLIEELNLNENRLSYVIDNEGAEGEESKTLSAAKRAGFPQAIEMDSKTEMGVRVADLLSGFVGRIVRAMESDLCYKGDDFKKKKLLDKQWFDLNNEQFGLYKKIANVLFTLNNQYYMSYAGVYGDEISLFFGLFRYIDEFETYEEFLMMESNVHAENFNTQMCYKLEHDFERFGKPDKYNK